MPVLCVRGNGTVSTHILTVLTVDGVRRLLSASRSPLAPQVLEWLDKTVDEICGRNSLDPLPSPSNAGTAQRRPPTSEPRADWRSVGGAGIPLLVPQFSPSSTRSSSSATQPSSLDGEEVVPSVMHCPSLDSPSPVLFPSLPSRSLRCQPPPLLTDTLPCSARSALLSAICAPPFLPIGPVARRSKNVAASCNARAGSNTRYAGGRVAPVRTAEMADERGAAAGQDGGGVEGGGEGVEGAAGEGGDGASCRRSYVGNRGDRGCMTGGSEETEDEENM